MLCNIHSTQYPCSATRTVSRIPLFLPPNSAFSHFRRSRCTHETFQCCCLSKYMYLLSSLPSPPRSWFQPSTYLADRFIQLYANDSARSLLLRKCPTKSRLYPPISLTIFGFKTSSFNRMRTGDAAAAADEAAKKIDFCDSWYYHDIKHLPESTRQLFEDYSGIPSEQVLDHIQHMVCIWPELLLLFFSSLSSASESWSLRGLPPFSSNAKVAREGIINLVL